LLAATSSSRWCLQLTQGQGLASCRHSARVVGRGIASIGSGVCFGAVKVGSVGCAADPAVLLAAEDDLVALVVPARCQTLPYEPRAQVGRMWSVLDGHRADELTTDEHFRLR
jgi:hypothetical protein